MSEVVEDYPENSPAARKYRRVNRMRQAMVELEREPAGLTWADLWSRVVRVLPEVADDLEKNASGTQRGQTDVRFYLQNLDKSGWIITGGGPMRITAAGREALRTYPDGQALDAAAAAGYKHWDSLHQPPVLPEVVPLGQSLVPVRPEHVLVQNAARLILEQGLRHGGSAFVDGRSAWDASNIAALKTAFVDHPDLGDGTFLQKLKGQLAGADDDVILLAAEMLSLILLPLSDWKPETKRQRVKTVLALMAEPVHLSPEVSAAMNHGVFNGSLAFKTLIWKAFSTVIGVASAWSHLDQDSRERTWQDPWAWRDLVESATGDTTTAAARAELAYLKHPETFLPIISTEDKRTILRAFKDELSSPSGELDRDLLAVTIEMQEKSGGPVDYYTEPFADRWRPEKPVIEARRAWLMRGSSVRGVDMIPAWLEDGYVSLAASQLGALEMPAEVNDIRAAVDEGYSQVAYLKREEKIREIRFFLLTMKAGDLVMTTSGGHVHIGTITGEAEQVASEGNRSNLRRAVEWSEKVTEFEDLAAELSAKLKSGGDVTDLTDVVDLMAAMLPPEGDGAGEDGDDGVEIPPVTTAKAVELRRLTDEEADALLVGQEWLDELVDLLNLRRQVILYGPPGTGKTYLALKTAEAIAPLENVRMVQFHPAYSYEDFFEGYRPRRGEGGAVGFELTAGPFRRIVEDAREHPEQPYVLIVDEINRANLAKVFGELYFLLEYRDNAIQLLNSEDDAKQFSLPKNVYLIGTMNTADRSIALVDAAMRRRFAFLSLHPDDPHVKGMLRAWLARRDLAPEPADLLDALNERVPERDFTIGPAYLMKEKELPIPGGLERIWRTSILPQLEELHYGDTVDVQKRYGLETLRKTLPSGAAPTEPL